MVLMVLGAKLVVAGGSRPRSTSRASSKDCLLGLIALGIVIVYRANRIINFAAADLGHAPATFAFLLYASLGWNIYIATGIGIAAAIVLGVVVEFLVHAPVLRSAALDRDGRDDRGRPSCSSCSGCCCRSGSEAPTSAATRRSSTSSSPSARRSSAAPTSWC